MATLIPENIASSSRVPEPLREVAAALRDGCSHDVVVYLEPGDLDLVERAVRPQLLLVHPRIGVLVLEAPGKAKLGLREKKGIKFAKPEAPNLDALLNAADVRAAELRAKFDEFDLAEIPCSATLADVEVTRKQALACGVPADEAESYLFAEDFERGKLNAALQRVLDSTKTRISPDQSKAIRACVRPSIIIRSAAPVDDDSELILFRPPEGGDALRVLDLQQERLAHHLGSGYRVVRGAAGSGKTLVLLHRARYLAEHFPQKRYLITCFNVPLAKTLEAEVGDYPNITVRTVDGIAYDIAKQNPKTSDEFAAQREAATARLNSQPNAKHTYAGVFVDEGQDLGREGLNLAWATLESGSSDFVVALDGAQNIYHKRARWNPPGTTARGRTEWLKTAYRNTRQIAEFAWRFLDADTTNDLQGDDPTAVVPPEFTARTGPDVAVIVCSDHRAEAEFIMHDIASRHDDGEGDWCDFAVLYGSSKEQTALYSAAQKFDVPYFCVSHNGGSKRKVMTCGNVVRTATFQSLKGLEFPSVYVCGVNNVWDGDNDLDTKRRLTYVALTRATDHLTVTVAGSGPIGSAIEAASTP